MKRRYRLTGKAEFQTALKAPRVFSGRGLVALAMPSRTDHLRVGVTASRQLKNAVERNRARRRVREVSRLALVDSPVAGRGIRYDVVLIARPDALTLPFAELRREAEQAARRIASSSEKP